MALSEAYDPTIFNIIPSLEDAHASVKANGHFDGYLKKFATIAAKLTLNDTFGLALVHRHTRMGPGSRMLDFKQTLQPFPWLMMHKTCTGARFDPSRGLGSMVSGSHLNLSLVKQVPCLRNRPNSSKKSSRTSKN